MKGYLGDIGKDHKVESSVYKYIGLDVSESRSVMNIRKNVGVKTQLCKTPLLIG